MVRIHLGVLTYYDSLIYLYLGKQSIVVTALALEIGRRLVAQLPASTIFTILRAAYSGTPENNNSRIDVQYLQSGWQLS